MEPSVGKCLMGTCTYHDRYDLLAYYDFHTIYSVDKFWMNWIWNYCSPLALQYFLCNSDSGKVCVTEVQMTDWTPFKLTILKECGIWFGEAKAEEAARECTLSEFKMVLDLCRSWGPIRCYKEAIRNKKHAISLTKHIKKVVRNGPNRDIPVCIFSARHFRITHRTRRQRRGRENRTGHEKRTG